MAPRPSWDKYFLNMCDLVATRATCDRKHVGSVIVQGPHIVSVGYNGSLAGLDHCIDVGCDIEDNHCVRVVHSEQNAICAAAKRGIALEGATIYCSLQPCWNCFKSIVSAGIKEIVYKDSYGSSDRVLLTAQKLKQINGFTMRQYIEL